MAVQITIRGVPEEVRDELDKVFANMLGSAEKWQRRRAELVAGGRWAELLY